MPICMIPDAHYVPVTDEEAVEAFEYPLQDGRDHSRDRIQPGAISYAMKLAPEMAKDRSLSLPYPGAGTKTARP